MARNCCRYFTVSLVPTASLILAVVFACGIVLLPILYVEVAKDYVYGVVLDAGSSHTDLYVYRWQVPSTKFTHSSTGEVEEIFKCPKTHSNSTSVNSYTSDPGHVAEAFAYCLNESYKRSFGEPIVPKSLREHTNLYLGATAGMRLVREQNKTLSDEIMDSIELALKNHNISQYNYSNSSILPGSEEARSGWVSTNYLYNNRSAFRTPNHTVGALDLGGASTQIVFESNATLNKDFYKNESVFGAHFNLYARSLLCYGENQAYSRFLASLIHAAKSHSSPIPNPCLFYGANVTVNSANIYTACVNSSTADRVFGRQLPPSPSLRSTSSYTFTGTGDPQKCRNMINSTLMSNFCNMTSNCPSGTFQSPPAAGHFVGFSGFYYTAQFFNVSNSTFNSTTGWDPFVSNVTAFCHLTKDYVMNVPSFKSDLYLYTRCFTGQFVTLLLENGFGLKKEASTTVKWSVEFKAMLDDKTLGWALGYILDQSSGISQDFYYKMRPYTVVDLVVGMVILVILCVIFVLFFLLTFYACRKALNTRSGYQNI